MYYSRPPISDVGMREVVSPRWQEVFFTAFDSDYLEENTMEKKINIG
jgi:hypothetical protein